MTHTDALTLIFNELLQGYQYKQCDMKENGLPETSTFFRSEKLRKALTDQINSLSQIAYDLGDHDLACDFMKKATALGCDAIQPEPICIKA
ncbi:hypothetical protein [Aliivibrio fischeri]|uniref:Uncharacterized protein n=1 Tax=Aliivibrio fischeri TaxID=668 RepID=A0A510UEZ4_ALIFS|nr:hypothetical protein [Aliivibrio fischeri]GEK13198.1 hypothetical protein AFI02nite_12340 [Aliivibrio fischeri]